MGTPDFGKAVLWTHNAEIPARIEFGFLMRNPRRKVIGVMDDIGRLVKRTGFIGDIGFIFYVDAL